MFVYKWALNYVCNDKNNGTPTQLIALNIIIKLFYIYDKLIIDNNIIIEKQTENIIQLKENIGSFKRIKDYNITKNIENSFISQNEMIEFVNTIDWLSLLTSMSYCFSNSGYNASHQWSYGMEVLIHDSFLLSYTLSRFQYPNQPQNAKYYEYFKILFKLLLMNNNNINININDKLNEILLISNNLISIDNNEIELHSNNQLKTLLFASILSIIINNPLNNNLQLFFPQLLIYFTNNISNISKDYISDWFEAILFVYSNENIKYIKNDLIINYLIELFENTLLLLIIDNESYMKHFKSLVFIKSILLSEIFINKRFNNPIYHSIQTKTNVSNVIYPLDSGFGFVSIKVYELLLSHILISPYEIIRSQLSAILGILTVNYSFENETQTSNNSIDSNVNSVNKIDMEIIVDKLLFYKSSLQNGLGLGLSAGIEPVTPEEINNYLKYIYDISIFWIHYIHQSFVNKRNNNNSNNNNNSKKMNSIILKLLSIIVEATGSSYNEPEFIDTCLEVIDQTIQFFHDWTDTTCLYAIIETLCSFIHNDSSQIKKTIAMSLNVLISDKWCIINKNILIQKLIKDSINHLLTDNKTENKLIGIKLMVYFLTKKTLSEIEKIAKIYYKNSESLILR